MGHVSSNTDLVARVRRITGQLASVERALSDGAECASVLQQVAAVRGAVNGLLEEIVESHLREHVAAPGLSAEERAEGAEEVLAAIRRYAK
jgi:DNA-binding FrmR family transcriptional regulator